MSFWKKKNQESEQDSAGLSGTPGTGVQAGEASGAQSDKSSVTSAKTPINAGATSSTAAPQSSENTESSFLGAIQQHDNTYNKVRSALSAGTVIQGKLSFDTPVRIDGKLSGEVYSSKVLIVGETAQINASIEASSLVIMGHVKGTITATEKVHLCSGSSLEGNIKSPAIIIDSGAVFNGKSEMTSSEKSKSEAKETKIYSNDKVDLEDLMNKSGKSEDSSKKSESTVKVPGSSQPGL